MGGELFIAVAVSIDTYLASAVYSSSGIKIPLIPAVVINLSSGIVLGISLLMSEIALNIFPTEVCSTAGTVILSIIGVLTVAKSIVRELSRRLTERGEVMLRNKSGIVIKLYLDDTSADKDNSKVLSAGESVALALASSFDSAGVGLGSGLSGINAVTASILTFGVGFIAVILGNLTGKRMRVMKHDFSWIGGILLIIFAFI